MKKNTNKFISSSLIAVMAVSMISIKPLAVQAEDNVNSNITMGIGSTQESSYVAPDAPIMFKLSMTDKVMKELGLEYKGNTLKQKNKGHKSDFGVVVTGGDETYFATIENGLITYSTDGNDLLIKVAHPVLDRYTTYTSYLIVGSALNKYEAKINSGGNAKSFNKYLEKYEDLIIQAETQTGSAIGEATQITLSTDTVNTTVLDTAKFEVTAKDDYGTLSTSGKLEVVSVKTTDGSELSDTFTVSKDINIVDGKAEIEMTNHKSQSVEVTVNTNSLQGSNKTLVLDASFNPGSAHQTTSELSSPDVTVGNEVTVKGQVTDIYENPVLPTNADVSLGEQAVMTMTGVNGMYEAKLKAPTVIDQSKGLSQALDVLVKTQTGQAVKSTSIIVNPGVVSKVIVNKIDKVDAGSTKVVKGSVKDIYGNNALKSKLNLGVSIGTITNEVTSDETGSFEAIYTAPTTSTKVVDVSVVSSDGLTIAVDPITLEVSPLSPSTLTLTTSASPKQGTPTTVSGVVKDIYGNLVADGTQVTVKNGLTVIGTATTIDGKYSIVWTPTASGILALTSSVGDISSPITNVVVATSGPVATTLTFNVSATSIEKGRSITISGNVRDNKGAYMPVGTPVIINVGDIIVNATVSSYGNYSVSNVPSSIGSLLITANVGSLTSIVKVVNVAEAGSITMNTNVASVMAGSTVTISGVVKDTNGVNMPYGSQIVIKNGTTTMGIATVNNGSYSYSYTPSVEGTLSLTATANLGTVISDVKTVTVTKLIVSTLTANLSSTSISIYGASNISGYAKSGDGTPLANKTIWVKVGAYAYDNYKTNSLGYYSFTLYADELGMGYSSIDLYVDNGKTYGTYTLSDRWGGHYYSDVRASTPGIYVHR